MKTWLLTPIDPTDATHLAVTEADSEAEARANIDRQQHAIWSPPVGHHPWLDPAQATCVETTQDELFAMAQERARA